MHCGLHFYFNRIRLRAKKKPLQFWNDDRIFKELINHILPGSCLCDWNHSLYNSLRLPVINSESENLSVFSDDTISFSFQEIRFRAPMTCNLLAGEPRCREPLLPWLCLSGCRLIHCTGASTTRRLLQPMQRAITISLTCSQCFQHLSWQLAHLPLHQEVHSRVSV